VQRAILAGDAATGLVVQRVVAKLDAGPAIHGWSRLEIGPRDTTAVLMRRLTLSGAARLSLIVGRILAGEKLTETPQDESRVTYAAKIRRDEGALDFAVEDAAALDRRVRALGDAPGCRVLLVREGAVPIEIFVREAFPETARGEPGRVLSASADGIVVAARDGSLRVARLQRAGGKDVDARAFLNGTPVRAGDRLQRPESSATSSS